MGLMNAIGGERRVIRDVGRGGRIGMVLACGGIQSVCYPKLANVLVASAMMAFRAYRMPCHIDDLDDHR